MDKLKFQIKQLLKIFSQNIILPVAYRFYALRPVNENKVILADSHHREIPYSIVNIKKSVIEKGYEVEEFFVDFQKGSPLFILKKMIYFMKIYAQAKYVFICDNFLPVSSCKKRKETIVVQLWHGGGLLKKTGYDTPDDIPKAYKGNVYKNYSLVSVSADCCVPVFERSMRQPEGVVHATGISRTDDYFDEQYIEKCRENFYKLYPEAKGKKLLLWAPTFRGKAGRPEIKGMEYIEKLRDRLGSEWNVLIKVHPHAEAKQKVSNCTIPTEQLLPVIDCLITDYSSVVFDYSLLKKPIVLFVPDRTEYMEQRGLYIALEEIPAVIVENGDRLYKGVLKEMNEFSPEKVAGFAEKYMTYCDGGATERIMRLAQTLGGSE